MPSCLFKDNLITTHREEPQNTVLKDCFIVKPFAGSGLDDEIGAVARFQRASCLAKQSILRLLRYRYLASEPLEYKPIQPLK